MEMKVRKESPGPVEPEEGVGHVGAVLSQQPLRRGDHALQQRLVAGRERLGVADVLAGHDEEVVLARRPYVADRDQVVGGHEQLRAGGVVAADLTKDALSFAQHGAGLDVERTALGSPRRPDTLDTAASRTQLPTRQLSDKVGVGVLPPGRVSAHRF